MANGTTVTANDIESAFAGRFNVGSQIGTGGQGWVFRATRLATPHGDDAADDVALKIYSGRTELIRVAREVEALTQIRHTSIANLVEHGSVTLGGQVSRYVACDYIDGTPLDKSLLSGPAPLRVVAVVGRDILRAICQLWPKRIVHRDINPKNVMLRIGNREAVLIDLGIARHVGRGPITSLGTAWGTEGYMSPEQNRAEQQLSCFSDVFSLGIVLQEMLIGRHPTNGIQDSIVTNPPPTLDLAFRTPTELAELIDQMLSIRPAFRGQPDSLAESFAELASTI